MDRPDKGKAPKAVAAAKGANIALEETIATPVNTAQKQGRRKRKRLEAIGPAGRFVVTGQVAKALAALVAAGSRGVTALEANSWAFRLAAYVHDLRHRFDLTIEMIREPHGQDWHGRYVLRSDVSIVEGGDNE